MEALEPERGVEIQGGDRGLLHMWELGVRPWGEIAWGSGLHCLNFLYYVLFPVYLKFKFLCIWITLLSPMRTHSRC